LVIYILVYLLKRLFKTKFKPLAYILIIFCFIFTYFQTKNLWNATNGLIKQKEEVRERIKQNNKIPFDEGQIKAYLWHIWVEDKKVN